MVNSNNVTHKFTMKEKIASLGPGFVIVGSFIGPGTVTSCTLAGATYGFTLFWCVVFSVIAVIVMQGMAARIGIITQEGLAENMKHDFADRPLLRNILCGLVIIAITIGGLAYMGGDLTGTAMGASALTGVPTRIMAPILGVIVLIVLLFVGDAVKYLEKLLSVCVTLMAIVFLMTMLIVRPDFGELLRGCIPTVPKGGLMTCLSLIGTTVVPYNMFLHAASAQRTWHTKEELPLCMFGTTVPMIIGGVITGSIMITSAVVMRGMSVNNAMDMAVQLEGTLGRFAQPFMALGLLSAGISSALCSPISVSYVLAGLFDWKTDGSDKRFLGTSAIILIVGIIISAIGTNPLALIMTAQAVNGIALPVVVGVTLYLASRQRIMGEYKNSMLQNVIGLMIFAISLILGISSFIGVFAG